MTKQFCGLDFGTSNSTVGVWKNDAPCLSILEEQKNTIPSAIFFNFEDDKIYYGRQAVSEYIDGAEGRLMRALKSVLGNDLMNEKTRLSRKFVSFQEILGSFIAHLKCNSEDFLGEEINHVVLGRPVFFVDSNPKADIIAQNTLEHIARSQGFDFVSFQYEPVAAALDYEQTISEEKLVLVIDIGGGTADFSVVRISVDNQGKADRSEDVLSNTGIHIGGTDFDRLFSLKTVMPHLGYGSKMYDAFGLKEMDVPSSFFNDLATWQKINFLYTKKTMTSVKEVRRTTHEKKLFDRLIYILKTHQGHRLAIEVEKAKIDLSLKESVLIDMNFIDQNLKPIATRKALNDSILDLVLKLKKSIEEALSQAQIKSGQIDTVFLTGGSTAIPLIRESLLAIFPNVEVIEGDRFGSVGTGLVIDAKRKFG